MQWHKTFQVLCQRLDLGVCATGSASDPLLLSGIKSTGRASGTLLFSRDKALVTPVSPKKMVHSVG